MAISTYEKDLYLNSRWRDAGALTPLGTVYVALGSADFTADGLYASELPSAGGYARIAVGTSNVDWSTPYTMGGFRVITNLATLTGGTVTADLNGGNPVGYWAIFDAATIGTGNLLRYAALEAPRSFLTGDQILIAAGALLVGI